MCYIQHKRYSCGHVSTIHTADYDRSKLTRPTNFKSWMEWSPEMNEFPSHPDTCIMPEQDCLRRGSRCPGPLEEMDRDDDVEVSRVCEQCAKMKEGK